MRGDNSRFELGIAVTDAFAAKRRFEEKDGLQRQHRWSIGYLDSRILGQFVFLVAVLSIFLGLIIGPWVGAGLFAAVLLSVIAVFMWGKRRQALTR